MVSVEYVINTIFTSRTYILSNDKKKEFWLIDCGDVAPLVKRMAYSANSQFIVKGVLLTHVHYDHIYGLPQLKELFPDVKIYTNGFGSEALKDEKLNYSRYHEDPIIYESDNIIVCEEGTVINLFEGVEAKVYHTPGHNPSCLTYEVCNYLFTGDAYIPGNRVVTTLKGSDKKLAIESVERIKSLAKNKIICPGHEGKEQKNHGDGRNDGEGQCWFRVNDIKDALVDKIQ